LSRNQTFKYKKLQAFAIREYKEKKPKKVIVRRISSTKIVPRSIIPRINAKSDIDLNPFLLISDFGSHKRLYYLLPDCTMLGAENYLKNEFEKIERKIKKYSKKVLELPQITAEQMFDEKRTPFHKIISQMKERRYNFKELEAKFVREFKSLSKLTGITGKLKNITLTDKKTDQRRLGVIVEKDKLLININCLKSLLIEGIIYRECLIALIPKYLNCDVIDFCSFGAFVLLPDEFKDIWFKIWKNTSKYDEVYLKAANKNDIKKIFGFFGYIKPYLDKKELTDTESNQLINIILSNFRESNRYNSLLFFKYLLKQVKVQDELFDILKSKEILLSYLLYKKTPAFENENGLMFVNLSFNLIKMKFYEFYRQYNKISKIPVGLNRLYQEFLRENKPIKLELDYPNQIKANQIIDFKIIISNKCNLTFTNLKIKDFLHTAFKKVGIEQEKVKIDKIEPFESIEFNLKLRPIKNGNLKLKAISFSCESNLNQIYKLKSKPIKIEIK